jgi:lauroyl/myristoyl acyltransferase
MIPEQLRNTLADSLLWLFWVPFRRLMQLLPLRAAYFLAWLLAWLASCFLLRLKRTIAAELSELLPDLIWKELC